MRILFSILLFFYPVGHLITATCTINSVTDSYEEKPANSYEGFTVIDKGAWCWFADPRALYYENKEAGIKATYIGCIDVHGTIKALQYNHHTGVTDEVLIRSCFQPDDHNNPTFLALPDGRIMIFYSRHTDEPFFYYRISQIPGDLTTLGKEIRLETSHNTTYPSPFILSDDPQHIYLCWRGINWHPTIARITLPDENDKVVFNWGPKQIVQSTAARPYAKYDTNGKDRISLVYTTGHPDNEAVNYIYYNYIDINDRTLRDIQGEILSFIDTEVHPVSATKKYDEAHKAAVINNEPFRNWIWQTAEDKKGNPVLAMVQINDDKTSHDYYYVQWTGKEWHKIFLENAGGHFHQTPDIEKCYSGGMSIDPDNPTILYGSVPVTGTYGKIFEIKKYTIAPDGTYSTEQITSNSRKNNIRPYVIPSPETSPLRLIWMHGNYYDWIVSSRTPGYPTAIHANSKIPASNKQHMNTQFTINLTITFTEEQYKGDIFKMGNLVYGLNPDTGKPYIKIGNNSFESDNVLGNSDSWLGEPRATDGKWPPCSKYQTFHLTLTYKAGVLRSFINGLADQYIETIELTPAKITTEGFNGSVIVK